MKKVAHMVDGKVCGWLYVPKDDPRLEITEVQEQEYKDFQAQQELISLKRAQVEKEVMDKMIMEAAKALDASDAAKEEAARLITR